MLKKKLFRFINWPLVGVMALLFFLGVLNLYSASGFRIEQGISVAPFYQKQLLWGLLGFVGMIFFMLFDYRHLKNIVWPLFCLSVILLILVPFVGKTIYGAKRWLDLGFMNFQPSELAKIAILILGAQLLSKEPEPLGFPRLVYILSIDDSCAACLSWIFFLSC